MATTPPAGLLEWPPAAASGRLIRLEEAILTFLPSFLVFLLTPAIFIHRPSQPVRLRRGAALGLKLYLATGLIILETTSMVLRCTSSDFNSRDFPALTIDLITATSVCGALYQEYRHALQASIFLGLHLALGMVVDVTKSRAAFRSDACALGYLSATASATRLVLLILCEIPKGAALVDGSLRKRASKESSSGFWSRTLFLWLNSILFLGFRTRLTLDDLDDLAPELSSETLSQHFKDQWHDAAGSPSRSLAATCSRILLRPLLIVALPRFIFAICSLAQPFALQRLLVAVQSEHLTKFTRDSLLQAFFLLYFSLAASRVSYQHLSSRLVTQIRGILIAELLDKSHTLSQSESMEAEALSLMNNDVEGVTSGVSVVHEIPFNIIETVLGMGCLALFVGPACLVILLPLLFSILFGAFIGKHSGTARAVWNEKVHHRVSETAKVLAQMRVIKMLGLGPTISLYLQNLREAEIASARSYHAFRTMGLASRIFIPTITPVLVVGAAFSWSFMGKLSAAQVFPSLAAVALIQRPLYTLISSISSVAALLACLERIQKYLELEEDLDPRVLIEPLPYSDEGREDEGKKRRTATAIEFIDVTLLSHDSESEILQQANFALESGSITAALGPSGSGKSALLQSLVGDANVGDGFIYVDDGVIGYADQSPWIRNVSIRANIIGGLAFDAIWYSAILRACLLFEDLSHFPAGDNYVAGTNGMNLSGGQRHRISLARALYCRARILVLDDIFSALDRKTAVSILFHLCGEDGLLRQAGCTVILATYLPECLEVADQLLLLDGKGGVALEKDFHEEWFRANLVEALHKQSPTPIREAEDKEKDIIQRSWELQDTAELSATSVPEPNRGFSSSLLAFFVDPIGRSIFALWVFSVFLVSFGETVPDIFIRVWISAAPESIAYFTGYVGASILATIASGASFALLSYVLAPRLSSGLHERLSHVVMHSTLAYFSCMDTGAVLNRYSNDMTALMLDLPRVAWRFFYMMFHIILQLLIIGSGTTYMVTVLPFIVITAALILYCYVQTSRQVQSMVQDSKAPLHNHLTETARGLRHIRAMGWRSIHSKAGLSLLDVSQLTTYTASSLEHWLSLAVDLLACGVCCVLTSLSLEYRAVTPVPAIGLSYLILLTFGMSLDHFIVSWAEVDTSANAMSRLRGFVENTPTEPQLPPIDLPTNWPGRGHIEMKNVTAKYMSNAPARLDKLSLCAVPGQKVGITGRSGSGKSSLFMALLGFLEYSGTIEIDGINVSKISRDTLRSRIITISQDHLDIGGTVRNNLRPFDINLPNSPGSITDIEIRDVLDSVGLLARIDRQGGLDIQLSKAGLSHGQLQLLSIARAILRGKETQSKVVLMDEATSNVDLETDAQIQKVLRQSFAGCTILMIAHRLETIQDANMFVELAHGKAVVVHK